MTTPFLPSLAAPLGVGSSLGRLASASTYGGARLLLLVLFGATLLLLPTLVRGQSLPRRATQTVRGTVLDAAAKAPVIGATVVVVGVSPALGAGTDANGRFRLPGVPVGRVKLRVLALGYEDLLLNEVTVTSGKEVVLDLGLTERLTKLEFVLYPVVGHAQ